MALDNAIKGNVNFCAVSLSPSGWLTKERLHVSLDSRQTQHGRTLTADDIRFLLVADSTMVDLAAHIPSRNSTDAVAGTTVNIPSLQTIRIRREHNKKQTINRLPVELLGMIFTILSDEDPPRQSAISVPSFGSSSPNLGWIRITHVSHYMRDVCLSMKLLWAKVLFVFPSATTEILARMESTPFQFQWDFSSDTSFLSKSTLIVEALNHLPQITKLALTADDRMFNDLANQLSPQTADLLEEISLTHSEKISPITATCYTFPNSLFAGEQTKLRHLSLHRCAVPWDSHLFQGLTRLEIVLDASILSSQLPSAEGLLTILSYAPSLTSLKLTHVIPSTSLPIRALRDVSLNHLQNISLVGERSGIVALWAHVTLPADVVANVECVDEITKDDCKSLASILSHPFKLKHLHSSYGLSVASDLSSAAVQVWIPSDGHAEHTVVPLGPFNRDHKPTFNLIFPSPSDKSDLEHIVLGLFQRVHFWNVQDMAFNLRGVQLTSWIDFLTHFPQLLTLYVHGPAFWRIAEALNVGYELVPGPYPQTALVPELRTLWLDRASNWAYWEYPMLCTRRCTDGALKLLQIQNGDPCSKQMAHDLCHCVTVEWLSPDGKILEKYECQQGRNISAKDAN